jgi:phosphoribosylformimino-5-aminoimidazole carboxamide ribonucleotide (ProFAR) isomerase
MIGGWILKLAVAFVIVGVIIYDGASIVTNFFTLDNKANEIALDLSTAVTSRELNANQTFELERRAKEQAKESGARLIRVDVDQEGTIAVRLRRSADTLVVSRIGVIEDWATATADARSGTS